LSAARRPIIVDCDAGVDDLLALTLALNSHEVELVAVTTVEGNVTVEQADRNVLGLLSLLGHDEIPVASGNSQVNRSAEIAKDAAMVHGSTGTGTAVLPTPNRNVQSISALDLIERAVQNCPGGTVTLVCTAPMTNVASLIETRPDVASRLKQIVTMGGAFGLTEVGVGNITKWAEFNVYVDPPSAATVYRSGLPVYAIGLDVTNNPDLQVDRARLESYRSSTSPGGRLAYQLLKDVVTRLGSFGLHDFDALATTVSPQSFHYRLGNATVDTSTGSERGRTTFSALEEGGSATRKERAIQVADSVDSSELMKLFDSRIIGT